MLNLPHYLNFFIIEELYMLKEIAIKISLNLGSYKHLMQAKQHGSIGISIFTYGFFPLTNSKEDAIATQRAIDFFVGW